LLREKSPRAITFGFSDAADVRGELLPSSEDGARFRVHAPRWLEAPLEASIPLLGRHNVANALAVTAAALHLDVPPAAIAAGQAGAVTSKMRMQVHRQADGTILLDDAYNASSPIAMEAALAVLAEQRGGRRAVAVLGDMLELGAASESAHAQVGRAVANLAPTLLVTAGPRAHGIAESARDAGLAAERVVAGADNDAALAVLRERLRPGDIILVKGSRGMAMESIVEALLRDQGDDR